MGPILIVCAAFVIAVFWLGQLLDVLHRSDDEFPGRNDKLIWTIVVLFGNVVGAIIYWLSKQKAAPASSDTLRREYAEALKRRDAGNDATSGPG